MRTRLNCREATPLIWERTAGDLPHEQAAALDAHLQQCPRCREESRRAQRAFQLLAAVDRPVEPRADGWDRLYRRITAPVVPLWRRLTAPALTSAAVTAATLAVSISYFVNVSPGPRGVVVFEAQSKPVPLPNVRIAREDGSFEATWLQFDDPTPGLRLIEPAPPKPDAAGPGKAVVGVRGDGSSRPAPPPPRPSGPVLMHATWNADSPPPKPVTRSPERPVDYGIDPYTGDLIGRPVGSSGA